MPRRCTINFEEMRLTGLSPRATVERLKAEMCGHNAGSGRRRQSVVAGADVHRPYQQRM